MSIVSFKLTFKLSLDKADGNPPACKALVANPEILPAAILTSTLLEFIAASKLVNTAFVTGMSIVSFKLTFKLSDDKADGNPPACKALVAAPDGKAELETVTAPVLQTVIFPSIEPR